MKEHKEVARVIAEAASDGRIASAGCLIHIPDKESPFKVNTTDIPDAAQEELIIFP